jgi:hypothetical protein
MEEGEETLLRKDTMKPVNVTVSCAHDTGRKRCWAPNPEAAASALVVQETLQEVQPRWAWRGGLDELTEGANSYAILVVSMYRTTAKYSDR